MHLIRIKNTVVEHTKINYYFLPNNIMWIEFLIANIKLIWRKITEYLLLENRIKGYFEFQLTFLDVIVWTFFVGSFLSINFYIYEL